MRLISLRSRWPVLVAFSAGLLLSPFLKPLWMQAVILVAQDRYASLVYKCDSAMKEHLLAKLALSRKATERHVANLEAAELALVDCQDYDLFQKRLLQFGLSENELSLMRLNAIEERAPNLQDVVRIHEIRF